MTSTTGNLNVAQSESRPLCLLQFPPDVLLYISSFTRLLDNLSFSMVCKTTYSLSLERSFWISALRHERLIRPIACPTHEDLTTHDLCSLRQIALHTLRLQRNWSSEKPRIMGDIKTLDLGLSEHDSLFRVPGTELYIFNCPERRTIELWHLGRKEMVGEPINISARFFDVSSGVDLPGKFMMGFLARLPRLEYEVFVICVEYGPNNAALKLILQYTFCGRFHWGLYLDKEFVGTLCNRPLTNELSVVSVNLSTKEEMFVRTVLPNFDFYLFSEQIIRSWTTLVDGNLCTLIVDPSNQSWVFTVPRKYLLRNTSDAPQESLLILIDNFSFFKRYCPIREDGVREVMTVTASTTYGVQALTIDTVVPPHEDSTAVTDVIFWVQPQCHGNAVAPLVPLTLSGGIPGSLFAPSESNFWQPMFQTFSGNFGLILSNVVEEDSGSKQILRLLSCDLEPTRKVTYRDLSLPDDLASRIHGVSVDDHLGAVSVIDSNGVLHAIPYA